MLPPDLIAMVRCPVTGQSLREADAALVAAINAAIEARTLRDAGDRLVEETIDSGLVSEDGQRVYPVRGEIPTLIPDWAILRQHVPAGP